MTDIQVGVSIGPYIDRIGGLPETFEFAEVAIGEGEVPLCDLDPGRIRDRLEQNGLGTTVHLPYRQPLSTPVSGIDEATLGYLEGALEVASELGAKTAVAHPSARGSGHNHLADRMEALSDNAESHGVTLCFETVGYAGGLSLDRVGELAADAGAAVCLDVGYAYLEAGTEGIEQFLGSYGDLVKHLHVHGARHRGDTHIPIGSGDVKYESLGPSISDVAPDTATVEVFTDQVGYLTESAERFEDSVATSGP
jgi:sugar phosphate isomerase/epimerase